MLWWTIIVHHSSCIEYFILLRSISQAAEFFEVQSLNMSASRHNGHMLFALVTLLAASEMVQAKGMMLFNAWRAYG